MNSGFVQFKTRQGAEAARCKMNGQDYFGMSLRIAGGKAVQSAPVWKPQQVLQPMLPSVMQQPSAAAMPKAVSSTADTILQNTCQAGSERCSK